MLSTLFFAQEAGMQQNPQGEQKLVVVEPLLNLQLPTFPNHFTLGLVCMIADYSWSINPMIRVTLRKQGQSDYNVDTGNQQMNGFPEKVNGLNLQLELKNILFKEPGFYEGEVFIDDKSVAKTTIIVSGRDGE